MTVRITGIAGSLRRESFNRKLLHAAAHEMPHGAELTVWDGLGGVPPDWASRPPRGSVLQGKPAAVISASPTPDGAAWAQADLRKILKIAGADVCDSGLAVPRASGQFSPGGLLADPAMNRGLTRVIADLLARAAAPAARQAA